MAEKTGNESPQISNPAQAESNRALETASMAKEVMKEFNSGDLDRDEVDIESNETDSAGDDESAGPEQNPEQNQKEIAQQLETAIREKDFDTIGQLLKIENPVEFFSISNKDHIALRLERKEIKKQREQLRSDTELATQNLTKLEQNLREKYGDPVQAKKLWDSGDYEAYFSTLEKWSGVPHAEVQKAWYKMIQGQTPEDLQTKKRMRELEREKAERLQKDREQEQTAQTQKLEQDALKAIQQDLKGHKLEKYPNIDTLVLNEIRQNYSKGITNPKLAIASVQKRLIEETRLRSKFGLIPKKKKSSIPNSINAGLLSHNKVPPTSIANKNTNSKKMTDAELAKSVVQEMKGRLW